MDAPTGSRLETPWLGERRGWLADWVTQRWVQATGRRVSIRDHAWLESPIGDPRGIGARFFDEWATRNGLELRRGDPAAGLLPDFDALRGPGFDPARVHPLVGAFYTETATFELDAWAHWCGPFRPFGGLLALLFSRRLQQLNVPLSGLDTSRGMTSEVLPIVDPHDASRGPGTAWVRRLRGTGHTIYAGCYTTTRVPGFDGTCVKVGFPLPNGNALVIMRPAAHDDGSFSLTSTGARFGDPGFYFTIDGGGGDVVARHLRTFRETIRVWMDEDDELRADHALTIWGHGFLDIHYRMRRRQPRPSAAHHNP